MPFFVFLVKVLSLTSIAALLSRVSPVFSKNLDPREGGTTNINAVSVVSPQSVISVYDEVPGYLGLHDVSKDNYITVPHTALISNASVLAEASDFIRSIDMNIGSSKTTTRAGLTPKTVEEEDQIARDGGLGNPLVHGEPAKGDSHDAIVYGQVAETNADQGIAIGLTALAGKNRNTKNSIAIGSSLNDTDIEEERTVSVGDFSIALDSVSKAMENGATAVGHRALAKGKQSISVGLYSKANEEKSVTLGDYAVTEVAGGVALGSASVSNVSAGVEGYNSLGKKREGADFVWNSTQGAVSIGDISKSKTR